MTDESIRCIRLNAALVLKEMVELHGVVLSYDENSVAWLDGHINRVREKLIFKETVHLASIGGSFFGECIRRRYGGEWKLIGDKWAVAFDSDQAVFPYTRVSRHLEGDGESIVGLYKTIPALFMLKKVASPPVEATGKEAEEVIFMLEALRSHEYLSRKYRYKGDAYYDAGNDRFSMEYHNLAAEEEKKARDLRTRIGNILGPAGEISTPGPSEIDLIRRDAEALPNPWISGLDDFDQACFCARYPRWTPFAPRLWCAYEKWKDDPRFWSEAPRFRPANPTWEP